MLNITSVTWKWSNCIPLNFGNLLSLKLVVLSDKTMKLFSRVIQYLWLFMYLASTCNTSVNYVIWAVYCCGIMTKTTFQQKTELFVTLQKSIDKHQDNRMRGCAIGQFYLHNAQSWIEKLFYRTKILFWSSIIYLNTSNILWNDIQNMVGGRQI